MRRTLAATITLFCVLATAADVKETHLNKLNVAAVDKEAQPVTGLQSSDFQLFEDGKPQKIVFCRFTGGSRTHNVPGSGDISNQSGSSPHATVVLIDLLSERIMSTSTVTHEVATFLKSLESSEGVYLYILTPHGQLYPVHALPEPGTEITASTEPWTQNVGPLLDKAVKDVFGLKPVDDREIKTRFDMTTNALWTLAQRAEEISGRRNLIWISHGVPLFGYSIDESQRLDFTNPLRRLCQELQRAQVVVYTVEQSMAGAAAAVGTYGQQTLAEATSITGGRTYGSDRADEAIKQAMTDSRSNYEIAYYSTGLNAGGKHHKIRVVCTQKDAHLQTVQGFYGFPPMVSPRDRDRAAFETAARSPFDATEIGLQASISPDPSANQNIALAVRVNPADLLLNEEGNQRAGAISVMFATYGDNGLLQSSPPIQRKFSLTPEQLQTAIKNGIELHETVPVVEAVRKVRVIVLDEELNAAGSVTVPVQK